MTIMEFSPEIMQLTAMIDDRDEGIAINILAQLLAREDELGDLPGILQESSDPLIRRRSHQLQSAITMRRRRRELHQMLNDADNRCVMQTLCMLHLLWFDKDQRSELEKEIQDFMCLAENNHLKDLTAVEMFMRKLCFLPENESTIHPDSYCVGNVLYLRAGASSLLAAVIFALLDQPERFRIVHSAGTFGVADIRKNIVLSGGGGWHIAPFAEAETEVWSIQTLLKYIAATLLSCAVNSDSYRYVMSITQALTGDESEHVFDDFPYPYMSNPGISGAEE